MRILISGVTSFLGLSVAKRLVASGHTVYGIVRENSRNREKVEGEKGITLLSLDMSEMEEEEKAKPLSILTFDMVFHFAWDGVGSAGRSDAVMQEKNLRMSKAFFYWAKAHAVKTFFFSGSQAEVGRGTREEPVPASPYGEKKLAFSSYGLEHHGEMRFVDLRIYSIYGRDDHEGSLVKTIVRNTLKGKETALGDGKKRWNFMAEEDFSRALVFLMDSIDDLQKCSPFMLALRETGAVSVDICSKESRPLSDYCKEIEEVGRDFLKKRGKPCFGQSFLSFGVRPPNVEGDYDFRPRVEELYDSGFSESVSFREGIERLYEEMENGGHGERERS
jgi:NAD dependent epimerase/dehydratase family protein